MRRTFSFILTALLLLSVFTLCACERDDRSHEEILQEIAESNKAKQEKRQAFLSSEVYAAAYDYVIVTLNELIPDCEAEISLEPGELLGADMSEYADFNENETTRLRFYAKSALYMTVSFWDHDVDPAALCDQLMARGISGKLSADQYSSDYYILDAETGKASFCKMPGV